jgi:hypothetical protein
MKGGGIETRGRPDDTIDINRRIAFSADEMVVVIPHSGLIQGGTPRRLDAPQDARGDQSVEIVIDRLTRKRAETGPRGGHDEFGIPVTALVLQDGQHRGPGGREAQVRLAKEVLQFGMHVCMLSDFLDSVKIID